MISNLFCSSTLATALSVETNEPILETMRGGAEKQIPQIIICDYTTECCSPAPQNAGWCFMSLSLLG